MSLMVYGVTRSGHRVPSGVRGIGEPPGEVRLVPAGPVALVVSHVSDDLVLQDGDAVTYLDTLTALLADGPVLPMRFATVVTDEDEAGQELLGPATDLVRMLDELDGLVEIRLEVALSERAEMARLLDTSAELQRLVRQVSGSAGAPADRIRLGEEISVGLAERRDEIGDHVRARLERLAAAYKPCRPADYTVLRQAYLVHRSELARFDAAVRDVRAGLGRDCAVNSVGPLPPFDFTDVQPRPLSVGRWGWD
jgi:hypothetical protein